MKDKYPMCDCCYKRKRSGVISRLNKRVICEECLKYAPEYYGLMWDEHLIAFIKKKKAKRWWQFWK